MKKILALLLIAVVVIFTVEVCGSADLNIMASINRTDSNTHYEIEINRAKNIVEVYITDSMGNYVSTEKTFVCSVGNDTPDGNFELGTKYLWRPLFGNVYGQYATRITGDILFHSVPYFQENKSTLEYEEYNKLGTTASMGCIRLCVADAKWIYENCASGTPVKIFYDQNHQNGVPLPPIKLDTSDKAFRGWDPTDPDENNPWNKTDVLERTVYAISGRAGVAVNGESKNASVYVINGASYINVKDVKTVFNIYDAVINPDCILFFRDNSIEPLKENSIEIERQIAHKTAMQLKFDSTQIDTVVYAVGNDYYINLTDAAELLRTRIRWNNDLRLTEITF